MSAIDQKDLEKAIQQLEVKAERQRRTLDATEAQIRALQQLQRPTAKNK